MSNPSGRPHDKPTPFGRRRTTPGYKPIVEPRRGLSARRRRIHAIVAFLAVGLVLVVGGLSVWVLYDLPAIPADRELWAMAREPGITFEDVNGEILATRGARNGYRVHLSDLPPYVPRAFLAAEDRRFYEHGAVELRSIGRAMMRNARADGADQGASTLTQQITRTILLSRAPTLKRKVQEAVTAVRLEQRMSKDQVLELYLNRTFFGARSYGLEAAAQQYFGHSAKTLTLSEAALLAAVPKAPSRLSPTRNFEAALSRSAHILTVMRAEGWISADDEAFGKAAPPTLASPPTGDREFGYVLDLAAAETTDIAGEQAPDLVVRLTIDPALQRTAQAIVTDTINRRGGGAHASQAALIAMTPDGAIRAVVGGVNHEDSPFNRATQALRQPGSSFKPLIFAAALERGISIHDVFSGGPVRVGGWRPANYGGESYGPMTVEQALVYSVNTIAVRLALQVGRDKIGEIARRFGVTTLPASPDLTVALGAYEVTLRQLTSAFQVFQNAGERRASHIISAISTSSGESIYVYPQSAGTPAYDPVNAGRMVRMMEGVVLQGTGRRADFGRPAAGKTGTSQDWRDAWFVGFTPDWAAGVWVGNDDSSSMNRVTGGDIPAEIWRRFMIEAHRGVEPHDFDFLADSDEPAGAIETEEVVETSLPEDVAPAQAKTPSAATFYGDLARDFAGEEQ